MVLSFPPPLISKLPFSLSSILNTLAHLVPINDSDTQMIRTIVNIAKAWSVRWVPHTQLDLVGRLRSSWFQERYCTLCITRLKKASFDSSLVLSQPKNLYCFLRSDHGLSATVHRLSFVSKLSISSFSLQIQNTLAHWASAWCERLLRRL